MFNSSPRRSVSSPPLCTVHVRIFEYDPGTRSQRECALVGRAGSDHLVISVSDLLRR